MMKMNEKLGVQYSMQILANMLAEHTTMRQQSLFIN